MVQKRGPFILIGSRSFRGVFGMYQTVSGSIRGISGTSIYDSFSDLSRAPEAFQEVSENFKETSI